jgi:glycosyltransferase involved in cell wall biosynthesis
MKEPCMDALANLRVVLVHDWLTGMRGGEKCLEALCRRFPRARLLSLLHRPGSVSPIIEGLKPRSSILQHLPGVHRYYRYLLPLMPLAARWRIPACDVVISLSHCVAKAARPPRGVPHLCYCFTPMRYAWQMREAYLEGHGPVRRAIGGAMLDRLQLWDRQTSELVTRFVAVSKTVQARIRECYGRDSRVIYPPVDTDFYRPAAVERDNVYLVVSAMAPYKRIDLAIDACNRLRRQLVIIGTGPEHARLRRRAGPTVAFLGWQPDSAVRDWLRRCRALLFPGEEEFGLVPVEAMACGTPVIAYGRGGATETVVPLDASTGVAEQATGIWFPEQSVDSLASAIEDFEARSGELTSRAARNRALRFSTPHFAAKILREVADVVGAGRGCQADKPTNSGLGAASATRQRAFPP